MCGHHHSHELQVLMSRQSVGHSPTASVASVCHAYIPPPLYTTTPVYHPSHQSSHHRQWALLRTTSHPWAYNNDNSKGNNQNTQKRGRPAVRNDSKKQCSFFRKKQSSFWWYSFSKREQIHQQYKMLWGTSTIVVEVDIMSCGLSVPPIIITVVGVVAAVA